MRKMLHLKIMEKLKQKYVQHSKLKETIERASKELDHMHVKACAQSEDIDNVVEEFASDILEKLDKNKDGSISVAELVQGVLNGEAELAMKVANFMVQNATMSMTRDDICALIREVITCDDAA